MAQIKGDFPFVAQMSGVFERKRQGDTAIVVTERYGAMYATKVTYAVTEPTAAQLIARERFTTASGQASADMRDPEKKEEWKAIAEASNGKYKTPYGAAFASYYKKSSGIE